MILYKYMDTRGIAALERSRLRVTPPNRFNDIFECLPSYEGSVNRSDTKKLVKNKATVREHYETLVREGKTKLSFKEYKRRYREIQSKLIDPVVTRTTDNINSRSRDLMTKLSQLFGVICLSELHDSLLMWAHYGGSHSGIVIGYDTKHPSFAALRRYKVEYSDTRKAISLSTPIVSEVRTQQILQLFYVKSVDWKYEREWRFVFQLNGLVGENESSGVNYYWPVPSDAVSEVIVGQRADPEFIQSIRQVLKLKYHGTVPLLQADLHDSQYALVMKRI